MKTLVKKLILTTTIILCFTVLAFAQNQVDGHLTYHSSWPMGNSTVLLTDMNGTVLQSAPTDGTGYFSFDNVPNGDYQLTATTQLSAGGIDMSDAFMIMMHLYNLYPFNSIQAMSADVDGDGMVTWNDYYTIVVGWFTQGYPFPAGEWTFETINLSLTGSREGFSGGITSGSTGDVNGSYLPDKATQFNLVENEFFIWILRFLHLKI